MSEKGIQRREFLKSSLAGSALAAAGVRSLSGSSANDRIGVAVIGTGRQGRFLLRNFARESDVEIVALCDVYEPNLMQASGESEAETFRDFRRVLDSPDVDAVVVATPDHWHALMSVLACQAGKDVFVEKPASLAVAEGRKMVEAARKYGRIVQVGTQQRSGLHFQDAVRIVQEGEIGTVSAVRTWNFGNSTPHGFGRLPDSAPPKDLDWDLWLGPAPEVPFNANRFGVFPDRWSSFRWYWDYAGGMMTDWGAHHLDIVQWAAQAQGPAAVSAAGGNWVVDDGRECPDTLTAVFEYPGFLCTYENRNGNGRTINEKSYGIEFYGSEGTLLLDRDGFEILPEHRSEGNRRIPRMYAMQAANRNDQGQDHVRNFLDCVRSREAPISDIEAGHASAAACHLANIAYRTRSRIEWDPQSESLFGPEEAAAMLNRPYRSPWKLEV